jgi:hypothetical protein
MIPLRALAEVMPIMLAKAAELAPFQDALNAMGTPAEQKHAIITAHCQGWLSKDDTSLLIQVYQLEEA